MMSCILSNQRLGLARPEPPPCRVRAMVSVWQTGAAVSRHTTNKAVRMASRDALLAGL